MKLQKFSSALQELFFEEAAGINGGEALWYCIAYLAGGVAHGLFIDLRGASNSTYHQSAGSSTMHKALK